MTEARRNESASRLSHDIGDVLTAIRRLIADDNALTEAQTELRQQSAEQRIDHVPEQLAAGAELLAGRYGGNAALARQLAGRTHQTETMDSPAPTAARAEPIQSAARMPDPKAVRPDPTPNDAGEQGREAVAERQTTSRPILRATRDDQTASPKLRLGAAHRVVPSETGSDIIRAPAQERMQVPWRPFAPQASTPETQTETHELAVEDRDFDGSRLTPRALATALGVNDNWTDTDTGSYAPLSEAEKLASLRERLDADFEQPRNTLAAKLSTGGDVIGQSQPSAEDVVSEPDTTPLSPQTHEGEMQDHSGMVLDEIVTDIPDSVPDESSIAPQDQPVAAMPAVTSSSAVLDDSPADADDEIENDEQAEQLIRSTIRDMIQEELHGELGQRFSRNIRAMIRREIALAIDEQLDRV